MQVLVFDFRYGHDLKPCVAALSAYANEERELIQPHGWISVLACGDMRGIEQGSPGKSQETPIDFLRSSRVNRNILLFQPA